MCKKIQLEKISIVTHVYNYQTFFLQPTCVQKNLNCNLVGSGKISFAAHVRVEKFQLQLTWNWTKFSCNTCTPRKISVANKSQLEKFQLEPLCKTSIITHVQLEKI
jgi:hypothetical protein